MTQTSHKFKTIVEHHQGYIGFCNCCQMVNVCYKNSLFCFQLSEYQWFCGIINERKSMLEFHTSHGKEIMMRTPMNNYYILFKESELDELSEMLQKAALLVETFRNIKNQN
ncbi:DUF6686 family protein [Arcicella sp. LKC2W]|uniref:DUF6686 family protein n=1 Tax=Arcicella sp. LKC2W TaxID=2984198 RepID=UPI002B1F2EDD|nr:DUF6686 family protein [Arcicella sp. LKC2W]MEA5460908.1 DUF6686 family protein [Arcicella sp. LKC2W]